MNPTPNPLPKVYFTKTITPDKLIELYDKLEIKLDGKIAIKIHAGEHDKPYPIQPSFMKPLVDKLKRTLVECNTALEGEQYKRYAPKDHWELIKRHGFLEVGKFDLMDEEGEMELPVPTGKQIKVNYVGSHLANYDSILVLSHFKGHLFAGFGGAMKNVAIGIASSHGKRNIHVAGGDESTFWHCDKIKFIEAMADAVKSVVDYRKGKMVYLSVMKDLSVYCDCDSNPKPPEMGDIGILSSIDLVALDQACVDLIYQSNDKGKTSLINRIEEKKGIHILEAAEELGLGSRKYELINVDKE